MAFSISYIYQITDRYSSKLAKIRKSTDRFTSSAKKATSKVSAMTKGMANLRNTASAAAIGLATLFPIKKAIDFEFAMADVLKVLGDITPAQFKALRKEIFGTSVAMGRLPKDITAVVAAGGRLGIPIEQLGEFTRLATKVSVAFDVVESVAGDSLASIKDKLGLNIGETANLMDAINHLADNTSAKAGGMIEIIGRLSGTMKTVEMPPEMIAGWAALADRVEVTPRLAASGMKMMMRAMKNMPGMMEKLLKAPSKTMADYLKKLAKIDKARLPKVLEKMFGAEAADFVEKLVGKIGLLDESLALVADKTKLAGSMQRELNKKLSTGKVKLDRIKSAFNVLAIVIGETMLPLIKAITPIIIRIGEKLKVFAEAHPDLSKFALILGLAVTALMGLAIAVGVAVTVLSGLATPILVALGVVTAIVAAFTLWTSKNEKLQGSLIKLWTSLKPLTDLFKIFLNDLIIPVFKWFGKLLGIEGKFVGWSNAITIAITAVADTIELLLAPFSVLGELIAGAAFGDMSGSIKRATAITEKALTFGDVPLKPEMVSSHARATAGTLNGNISVSAQAPAQVKRAEMETSMPGNLGFNLAPAH